MSKVQSGLCLCTETYNCETGSYGNTQRALIPARLIQLLGLFFPSDKLPEKSQRKE